MLRKKKFINKINFKLNNNIKFKKMLVIDENGNNQGILTLETALNLAKSKNLDLFLVSDSKTKPVAKILNYGKYQYQLKKKKKKTKTRQIREIKFKVSIDTHDLNVKIEKIRQFLLANDFVKISIRFRGREITRKKSGFLILEKICEELKDIAVVEKKPVLNRMLLDMYLVKKKGNINEK